jgi:hypothetical protein
MAAKTSGESSPTWGQRAKRAGLFFLFGIILMIPRIRGLRRRVWAWTLVRLSALAGGGWLIWRFAHVRAGAASLAAGLLLAGFAVLVRAKPPAKSVDQWAEELAALIVLNGGTFRQTSHSTPVEGAQIFVRPDDFLVVGPGERQLLRIPLSGVRSIVAQPVKEGAPQGTETWELVIDWSSDGRGAPTFRYHGTFAEHLARVAESTLRSQWQKGLPVIPS